MKLNDRLKTVASFVQKENHAIDVGCDHALLSIYLVENNLVAKIVASDNKTGPLAHAKKNISDHALEGKIKVQLADGITVLDQDIDTIIISGMGGRNMIGICKYQYEEMKQIKTLILSPNNDTDMVRKEFVKMGFLIDKEALVKEKNVIYPVIRFKRGRAHYKKEDYLLGPLLRKENSPLFQEENEQNIAQKKMLLKALPKKYWQKKREIKKELKIRTNKVIP